MQALLVVDHGSRRAEANARLGEVVALVEREVGADVIVEPAHMELAEPTLRQAFARCVARGATEVVVVPYFLSPGRHAREDIPRLAAAAAAEHPSVRVRVAEVLGPHRRLAALVALRAGIERPRFSLWREDARGEPTMLARFESLTAARDALERLPPGSRAWIERARGDDALSE